MLRVEAPLSGLRAGHSAPGLAKDSQGHSPATPGRKTRQLDELSPIGRSWTAARFGGCPGRVWRSSACINPRSYEITFVYYSNRLTRLNWA
jgi:hypothetical protein